jgi:hypothetical protein
MKPVKAGVAIQPDDQPLTADLLGQLFLDEGGNQAARHVASIQLTSFIEPRSVSLPRAAYRNPPLLPSRSEAITCAAPSCGLSWERKPVAPVR